MKINLLPPQAQAELFDRGIKKLIIILGLLMLIFLLSLTVVLFSVRLYISSQVSSNQVLVDQEKQRLEGEELQNVKEEIKAANKDLSELNFFYQEQINILDIFEKIAEILPPSIYLTSFSYQKHNLQVSITGYAPDTEVLLDFTKKLETEFPDPYLPTQNWIKDVDIDFEAKFNITKK